jgi:hypothetical protein
VGSSFCYVGGVIFDGMEILSRSTDLTTTGQIWCGTHTSMGSPKRDGQTSKVCSLHNLRHQGTLSLLELRT